jgi:2-haloacid dehalogenase
MKTNRREFLIHASAATALAAVSTPLSAIQKSRNRCRAVAFDAFVIFDPRPPFALAESLFPDHGSELNALWKTRLFEYTWLRTLSGRYADFPSVIADALIYAAKSLKIDLKPGQKKDLLDCFFHLKSWPDVLPAVRQLHGLGLKLGFLSNFSEAMFAANLKSSGLDGCFDQLLSTDRVKAYKPDPRAYQMGIEAFKLKRTEIVFAAFGAWDAAGAKSFGYTTFWVNRAGAVEEELGAPVDATGEMSNFVDFVGA